MKAGWHWAKVSLYLVVLSLQLGFSVGSWAVEGLVEESKAGKEAKVEALRVLLQHLCDRRLWGEVVLADGRVRAIQVDALRGDSVAVREVIGALQERAAIYRLDQFSAARELGEHRIPSRRPQYLPPRSMATALALETLIPGGGYFYIGEPREGLILMGLAAAAVGTGIATGKKGAAGWVPISAWIKIASLLEVRDQVKAINQSGEVGSPSSTPGPEQRPGEYWRGEAGWAPFLQMRFFF